MTAPTNMLNFRQNNQSQELRIMMSEKKQVQDENQVPEGMVVKEYPAKPYYTTKEVAELANLTDAAIRMAKKENRIKADETMSTERHPMYTPEEVQRFANERDIYIIFTIGS